MANNLDVLDAAAATKTLKTTDAAGVHTPHHNVDSIAAGDNNIGNVDIVTLPALPAGTNAIGKLAANSGVDIGDVDVTSLPPLPAGTNNIGDVDVLTLPALPAGTNAIGKLAANSGVDIGDVDIASIAAGENHLGEVGGSSITVTPTHTVDTAVYAAGDTVGTIITIANAFRASGKAAILQSIRILDRSNQKPTGNLLFFNASPSAATTTDNAAFVYSTDDLLGVARVPIVASDYVTINSKAVANLSNLGRLVYATTGTSLFVVFVTDGAPDFVASTDLSISYSFLRD
jgi:hypothetical protein